MTQNLKASLFSHIHLDIKDLRLGIVRRPVFEGVWENSALLVMLSFEINANFYLFIKTAESTLMSVFFFFFTVMWSCVSYNIQHVFKDYRCIY